MVQLLCKQNKDMIRVLIFTFRGGQALCPYFAVKFERLTQNELCGKGTLYTEPDGVGGC